ncbi:MAG: ABC transporter permease [Thermodesulforhabdaceae bacterium]
MNIIGFIVLRFLRVMAVVFVVTLACALTAALLPGDPAELVLKGFSDAVSEKKILEVRRMFELETPPVNRFFNWIKGVLLLDFGNSYKTGEPVIKEIGSRLPSTIYLALGTLLWVIPCSVLGAWGSVRFGFLRRIVSSVSLLGLVIPDYILGLLLFFGTSIALKSLGKIVPFLPYLVLGLPIAAFYFHVTYALIIQVLNSDYIRFAYAKGLSEQTIFLRHVVPSILPSLLAVWSMSLGRLLGGAVVVETIFGLPGIGRLFVEAVFSRDYPLVEALVLWSGWIFAFFISATDAVLYYLAPSIDRGRI